MRESSALDYIRGLLGRTTEPAAPSRPATSAPVAAGSASLLRVAQPRPFVVGAIEDLAPPPPEAAAPSPATPPAPATERSQWDRIALTNDIELHVRRPLSRLDNKRVERLITIARQLLGEDQP